MYGLNKGLQLGYSMDYAGQLPLSDDVTTQPIMPSTPIPVVTMAIPSNEYDSILSTLKAELGYSSSGRNSYGSPSSLIGTNNTGFLHRSISTVSLRRNLEALEAFSPLVSSATAFAESETSSVREVFSTGDLQGLNLWQRNHRSECPLSNETTSIFESMNKACKYSPKEKKERIERYRNKRNLRNFSKKIKYECRKTLADGRPRIRGRFARNDEIEKTQLINEWGNAVSVEVQDEDNNNWLRFLIHIPEV